MTNNPAMVSQSQFMLSAVRIKPAHIITEPKHPKKVIISLVTHAGILPAIYTNTFFSKAYKKEFCILTDSFNSMNLIIAFVRR